MNHCKDCIRWDRNTGDYDQKSHGSCNSRKFIYYEDYDVTTVTSDTAIYWDAEGYRVYFETGEMFGCIHWKAK